MAGVNLNAIYNRLATAPKYHPMSANTFADWTMEAGDIVTVSRDGTGYSSPVGSMTMKWNGKQQIQISSEGSREREPISRTAAREFARGGGGSGGISQNHYWHQFVTDQYNQLQSGIELTGSTASLYVDNKYAQMRAGLDLTSSSASLYVDNRYKQMKSGLELTSSSASLYVDNRYKQMKAGLDLTSSSASLYVDNKYSQMTAGLKLTSSSAALYVDNKYTQMTAGLKLTSSSAALYVNDKYNQMSAGLNLTSSSAAFYVNDRYKQMKSGLELTSSSAAFFVDDSYKQMKAGLNLTSSSAAFFVNDRYKQMKSGLELTSSTAAFFVNDSYKQMKAGLDLTSSSAAFFVESAYDQMKAGLEMTSSSAGVYVRSRTSRAQIIARINEDGSSEDVIHADKVSISGTTTINDVMTMQNNYVHISAPLQVSSGDSGYPLQYINGVLYVRTIAAGSVETPYNYQAGNRRSFNVVDAQVNNNVLTITYADGSTVNFSKAASLTGDWSGAVFVAKATPGTQQIKIGFDNTADQYLVVNGVANTEVFNDTTKYITKTYNVQTQDRSQSPPRWVTRYTNTINVDGSGAFNAGYRAGWSAYYNDSHWMLPTHSDSEGKAWIPSNNPDNPDWEEWFALATPTIAFTTIAADVAASPSARASANGKQSAMYVTVTQPGTYVPAGDSDSRRCLVTTYNNQVVGRYDTQSVYEEGVRDALGTLSITTVNRGWSSYSGQLPSERSITLRGRLDQDTSVYDDITVNLRLYKSGSTVYLQHNQNGTWTSVAMI